MAHVQSRAGEVVDRNVFESVGMRGLPAQKLFIALVGFSGAMLAVKLPFVLLNEEWLHHAGSFLFSGKTVLLGLVGGKIERTADSVGEANHFLLIFQTEFTD